MASSIARSLVRFGVWEPATTKIVLDLVKPGMKVLSVGANFGYYALLMAKSVGLEGHVWAFEPTQKFRDQLTWHVEQNGFGDRVTILPYGLSDAKTSVSIELMEQSASMHFPPSYPNGSIIGSETIRLELLDEVSDELGIGDIDFISMDIDGHEARFLRGAISTLKRSRPPMVMEFAQSHLHVAGSDVREVAALLHEIGYEICSEETRLPYEKEIDFLRACGNFSNVTNALVVPRETGLPPFGGGASPSWKKCW